MKKMIMCGIALFLLATSLYAANGDLIVNGKLGIGTTEVSPGSLTTLGVVGTSSSNYVALTPSLVNGEKSSYTFYSTFENYPADHGARRTADIIAGYNGGVWGNEYLSFNVGGATDNKYVTSEKMRITSIGNVGIGTTNPVSKLSVGGNGGYSNVLGIMYAMPTIYGKTNDTNNNVGMYGESSSNSGAIWNFGVAGKGLGTFGMGVLGNGTYAGVYGYGNYYDFYAAATSGLAYGSASSVRWKKNITPIGNALAKVMALRGVNYDLDEEHGNKHDIGFIGEEVAKVLPEITAPDPDAEGFVTGMDYSRMTPLLLEAIKEQQQQITDLKQQTADLKQLILDLKKMNK